MLLLCVNCRKYFSQEIWWIINVQIFSLLMQLFMGHIVSSLHLLKERIFFFMCILNLVFKFGVCVFLFPISEIFPETVFPKTCVFSYFDRGRSLFLSFILHRGSCLYFLASWIVLCSLDSLFSLILYCICLLFIELSLSIRDKKGEI